MNLNDYFEPVELDRPAHSLEPDKAMFGQNIRIHTPNTPIDDIGNYQVALFGVCEEPDATQAGPVYAPDAVRSLLYQLYRVNDKVKIIDLGNFKKTKTRNDTLYGIRDVMHELLSYQIPALVIGGSQDMTLGTYLAFESRLPAVNVVTVDSRLDLSRSEQEGENWLGRIGSSGRLLKFTNLGHQQYLVNREILEKTDSGSFESVRLGVLRSNISVSEPVFREAHLVSFDISAVRQSDSPGSRFPSPNGFSAEEACQLARYAGLGDRVSCFGLYELFPPFDVHDQSAHLAAQMIWHFIEGVTQRYAEKPEPGNADFKVFVIRHDDMEYELTFYKSLVTGRWWMDVPDPKAGHPMAVPCSAEEYQQACNHEIPDLWWKVFQRIN